MNFAVGQTKGWVEHGTLNTDIVEKLAPILGIGRPKRPGWRGGWPLGMQMIQRRKQPKTLKRSPASKWLGDKFRER